jgi:pilus assembly protein CpaE
MPVFLLKSASSFERHSEIATRLRATLPALVDVASLDAVLRSADGARGETAIAIVPLSEDDRNQFDSLVDFAARHRGEVFLILIGGEISANDYKRLVRSGGADWASANADSSEVAEIVVRRQRYGADLRSPSATSVGSRPAAISFVPSAGGVGNTTLIIETAAQIKTGKATRQRNICIVDLDFQTSHVCDYLDIEPRLQIAELSNAPQRLDEHLFESFRTTHNSGIDVFAAPRSKFPWDSLNIDALDALFGMIAMRYDLVLIDFPVSWFPWTTQVIAASDAGIVTGTNTIPCLRQIFETLALVRSNGAKGLHIGIAINRCEYTMLGSIARRKHVEMVLRDERLFFVGEFAGSTESINMGKPRVLGGSARKLRKDLAPLAEFCAGLRSARSLAI